jgi:hypothetical protein
VKKALQKIVLFLALMLNTQVVFSQGPPNPPGDNDPPELSINQMLIIFLFLALILGYIVSKKYILTKKSSL